MKAAGGFAKIWRGVYGHAALRDVAEEAAFIVDDWPRPHGSRRGSAIKDKAIHLKRGQLALSQRDLAAGLGWSIGLIQQFTDKLKTESMVDTHAESGVTIITICNYDDYQAVKSASR